MDTYPIGLLLVPACVAASLAGLAMVRRSLHRHDLESIQEVASYLFAVVGTLYAVILGLIVVDSMSKFSEARLTAEAESNALSDVLLFASQLPGESPRRIRDLASRYIDAVVDEEWDLMGEGRHSPRARELAVELSLAVLSFEPSTPREEQIFASQIAADAQFWNSRRTRTMIASHRGLPTLEWVILIAGGVITVVFTYFFKVRDLWLQMAMTAMLSAIIALNLYLILMYASPFSGDVRVDPVGFELSRYILNQLAPFRR